ncbi:DUF305 domain-containing protein [Streptomyces sp. NPDC059761]|uniref:DUF305 domain-containing protein n=1 Tax=Streptomyces sp. NPDC059761 TaxID=3346937 RepID=UPI0036545AA7
MPWLSRSCTDARLTTRSELAQLRCSSAREAEALYLQLMVRHHRSGIAMAQGYVDRAAHPMLGWLAGTRVATGCRIAGRGCAVASVSDAGPAGVVRCVGFSG